MSWPGTKTASSIRRKIGLANGAVCPNCWSRSVVGRGKPRYRRCRHCGHAWEQFGRGESGDLFVVAFIRSLWR